MNAAPLKLASFAAIAFALLVSSAPADEPMKQPEPPAIEGKPISFRQGPATVELVAVFDELRVAVPDDGDPMPPEERLGAFSARVAGMEAVRGTPRTFWLRLKNVNNFNTLERVALEMTLAMPGAEVRAVAYRPNASSRLAWERQAVTKRIALQLKEGADPETFAREHGLRLEKKLEFGPNIHIATPERSKTLLAAVDAANALGRLEQVEFAEVQIEKFSTLRPGADDPGSAAEEAAPPRRGRGPVSPPRGEGASVPSKGGFPRNK